MEFDVTKYVVGGTYLHKSRQSKKQCVNFWPQIQQDDEGKSVYILESFPGTTSFASGSGMDRGMFEHLGTLYKVNDTTLYSISSAGVFTSLGTIAGASRCIFASIGGSLLIAADGVAYEWDGSTLTAGTDADFESPSAVTGINNTAVYDGNEGRFCTSNVGDYLNINALNYATAESDGDNLLRPYKFGDIVYMFGDKTIEPWWYNPQKFNPPLDKVQGGVIPVGLGGLYSVANNDRFLYFLGDDNQVYRIEGSNAVPVSTQPITRQISNFTTISDCIGWTTTFQGADFYVMKFPTEDKTLVYQQDGEWFNLSTGLDGGAFDGNSYAYAYRKHLIADESGNVLEWDEDTYTENSATIQRTIDSAPINGALFGYPGREMQMKGMKVVMQVGTGTLSGQGQTPQLMLSFSDDGGKSYSDELWEEIGEMGEYQREIIFSGLGSFRDRIIRLRVTDPVYVSIHQVMADLEVGI